MHRRKIAAPSLPVPAPLPEPGTLLTVWAPAGGTETVRYIGPSRGGMLKVARRLGSWPAFRWSRPFPLSSSAILIAWPIEEGP